MNLTNLRKELSQLYSKPGTVLLLEGYQTSQADFPEKAALTYPTQGPMFYSHLVAQMDHFHSDAAVYREMVRALAEKEGLQTSAELADRLWNELSEWVKKRSGREASTRSSPYVQAEDGVFDRKAGADPDQFYLLGLTWVFEFASPEQRVVWSALPIRRFIPPICLRAGKFTSARIL